FYRRSFEKKLKSDLNRRDAPRGTALRGLIALPMRFFWQGPSRSLLAVAVAVGASSVWVSGALIYDPPGALAD
ncbi:MAG: hypothetical protein DME89_08465, partial [Verrucomicrobia bacterium]